MVPFSDIDMDKFMADPTITAILTVWGSHTLADGNVVYSGRIYRDRMQRFFDGYFIHTSAVKSGPDEHGVIITLNNVYLLAGYKLGMEASSHGRDD